VIVAGATPGAPVTISAEARTNAGRRFNWSGVARALDDGSAAFRIPYASGKNGAVDVVLTLDDGTRRVPLQVADADVLSGRVVSVSFDRPPAVSPLSWVIYPRPCSGRPRETAHDNRDLKERTLARERHLPCSVGYFPTPLRAGCISEISPRATGAT
jgi:hypothetical protein